MNSDNQVIVFMSNKDFQDEEYGAVKEWMESSDIGIKIVAPEPTECIGLGGTELMVDMTSDEVNFDDYAGVIFIGGSGTEQILNHTGAHALAKSFNANKKLVAAICWSVAVLAKAGVLNGRRATAWSGAKDDLIKGGAQYTGEPVTVDGNIVTADGPDSASFFGQAIAKIITGV